ncbi:MAG: hypothetical protein JSW27_25425 [Phycisphaerales bacterium]|nr:MAG: hypothetical protein JSW27_25425 [Phycisphaerales bacterium]
MKPHRKNQVARLLLPCLIPAYLAVLGQAAPREFSGVYPHLAHFNSQDECGTGAVVPWAERRRPQPVVQKF